MNQQKFDAPDFKVLAAPLYAMSVLLILVPMAELGAQVGWRPMPGLLAWRTGVVGVLSSMTATPTFGLILAIVTAFVCGHRRTLHVLAGLAAFATVLTLVLLGSFVLDALQMRPSIRPDLRPNFMVSVTKALFNFGLTFVTLVITTIGAFRAGRAGKARTAAARESRVGSPDSPLVVGTR